MLSKMVSIATNMPPLARRGPPNPATGSTPWSQSNRALPSITGLSVRASPRGWPYATTTAAYVGEPQTNGVIERFWKTLKKQVLEGRIYQTLADLRRALVEFMGLYNRAWRLEKL